MNFDVAMAGLRANAKISEIISKTGNEIADIQMQTWEAGQARTDRSVRSYGNRILETTDIVDPNTGQQMNVWGGSNYYWMNDFNEVAGTNLYQNPDPSRFRKLVEIR